MANTVETIYRWKHDRASMNAAIRDQKKFTDAVEDSDRAAERTADAYTDMERAATRAAKAQREAAEASIRAAREQSELVGDTASRVSSLSGLASGLGQGAAGGQLMLAADLLDAAEAAKLMSAELPALASQLGVSTTALGVMGLAAGALVVGMLALKSSFDDAHEAAQREIEAIERRANLNQEIAAKTSVEIQAEIDANNARLANIEEQKLALYDLVNYEREHENELEETARMLGLAGGKLGDYNQQLEELQKEQDALNQENREYSAALLEGKTATNDAAEAEKRLADERLRSIQGQYAADLEYLNAVETLTEDQLNTRIEALSREMEAIKSSGYYFEEAGKARFDEIASTLRVLEAARPLIKAREDETATIEAEKKAVEDLTKTHDDALKSIQALNAERDATNDDILSLEQEFADKSVAIAADRERAKLEEEADFARKRVRDIADHYADLADLDADYYSDRQSLLDDLGADLGEVATKRVDEARDLARNQESMARDHGKRMRDIQSEADRTIRSAALRRDAIAIYEAQQKAREDLRDEQEQYRDEKRERETAYRDALRLLDRETQERKQANLEALRQLDQRHRQEYQKREQAFQQQLSREDQDRAIRLQRLQDQHAREDMERTIAYNNQLTDLQTHNKDVRAELQQHYDDLFAIHNANDFGIAKPSGVGVLPYPEFARGGYTPGGPITSHPGEFVMDPATTRMAEQGMGQRLTQNSMRQMITNNQLQGPSVTIQGGSMTAQDVTRVLDRWWDGKMRSLRT